MTDPPVPNLLVPLADLARWLGDTRTPSVIVGGVAVSLLSRPRFTQDIDALVWLAESDWEPMLAAAPGYGIVPRIGNPLEFAQRTRVLLLRHVATDVDIDLILGGLELEKQTVDGARILDVGGVPVRLPQVEHLLIMKAIAHRPLDLQDVAALLEAHPEADIEVVRRWVGEFAAATAMYDLVEDLERTLARRKKRD